MENDWFNVPETLSSNNWIPSVVINDPPNFKNGTSCCNFVKYVAQLNYVRVCSLSGENIRNLVEVCMYLVWGGGSTINSVVLSSRRFVLL
jgi:hypothetical protein